MMTVICLFLLVTLIFAGEDPWGIGVLTPASGALMSEQINFPDTLVTFYSAPGGNKLGHLYLDPNAPRDERLFADGIGDSVLEPVHRLDLRELTYEGSCLKFYDRQDQAVLVLVHTFPGGVWLSVDELNAVSFTPLYWGDFFMLINSDFYPFVEGGLNVRPGPGTGGEPLLRMDSENYVIHLTGDRQGYWFKAEVRYYEVHPCEGGLEPARVWQGWIKALDDRGRPYIWYHTRGC